MTIEVDNDLKDSITEDSDAEAELTSVIDERVTRIEQILKWLLAELEDFGISRGSI